LVRARAVSAAGPYDGQLVDAHAHLKAFGGVDADALIALYDGAGVRGAILFGEPWQVASDARGRYPDRIVPFLAEGYANALHPDSSYTRPDGLHQLFSANVVRGLGEVICRHSPYRLGAAGGYAAAPANNIPADHPVLVAAYRVAAEYGAPVNIHQEWFHAAELERALRAAPDTTFVWAHAGHGGPDVVRGMLARNPNLMADLSARTPWIGPGTVLLRPNGVLAPEWAAVLREFADRFVIGLDLFAPAHYQQGYVSRMVDYYRGLLGQVEPDVAALIGHGNAERIAPFETG
ncbi:MAG: amidohydrolase, partial [Chloroflexota bacterium]|nr:amidohydrolase [Chloroflexota bacterium]